MIEGLPDLMIGNRTLVIDNRLIATTEAGSMTPLSQPPDFLILIGPNGGGKSFVGRTLASRFPAVFASIEEFFMAKYGTQEAFRSDQPAAYRALCEQLNRMRSDSGQTVIFEQVGLSEEEKTLIASLVTDRRTVLVEVIVDLETSMNRINDRGTSANFQKTPDSILRVRNLYFAEARPLYQFSLEIQNVGLSENEICAMFVPILGPSHA